MIKRKLGDILELHRGYDLPIDKRENGIIPIIGSNGICGFHNTSKATAPCVATGRSGTIGKVFYVGQNSWPLNTSLYVSDFKGNEPRYIYYLIKNSLTEYTQICSTAKKSVVPSLDRNVVHSFDVLYANKISEQRKISSILSAIDSLIENNNALSSTLEETAKTLYDYWFTQFDFPNEEGKPYRSSGGKMVWNEELKREIPEGWEVKTLDNMEAYTSDYTANGSFQGLADNVTYEHKKSFALLVRIIDFNNNFDKSDDFIYINKSSYDYLEKCHLYGDEIVLCNVGAVGNVYRVPKLNYPMALGPNGIVLNHANLNNYLYMYFTSSVGQKQIKSISSGSIQMKFNKTNFRSLPILLPPHNIIDKFNNFYNPIYHNICALWSENKGLSSLRDYLLPLLMNGQVTIED